MTTRRKRTLAIVLLVVGFLAFALRRELSLLAANRRPDVEGARLATELRLQGDEVVAEVGSGNGRLTVAMARRLPRGRMYSTELDEESLRDIREGVAAAGLRNVEVRPGELLSTNLPEGCCDAVYMRTVYHHFSNPAAMLDSLHATIKPGGRLGIIELEPRGLWRLLGSPSETPDRGGHGVPKGMLILEVTGGGRFTAERVVDDWVGPFYLVVFRRSPS